MYLNKNFSIFIVPILYFIGTIIYYFTLVEINYLTSLFLFINVMGGLFYLIVSLGIYTFLDKSILKDEIKRIKFSNKMKRSMLNIRKEKPFLECEIILINAIFI